MQQPSNPPGSWSAYYSRGERKRSQFVRLGETLEGYTQSKVERDGHPLAEVARAKGKSRWLQSTPYERCQRCDGSGRLPEGYCDCRDGYWAEKDDRKEQEEALAIWRDVISQKRDSIYKRLNLSSRQLDFTWESYVSLCKEMGVKQYPWVDSIKRWVEGHDGQQGLILKGPTGGGKTGLMIVVLRMLIEQALGNIRDYQTLSSWYARWTPSIDLFDMLRGGFGDGSFTEKLLDFKGASILFLDDLGTERVTGFVMEELMGLINHFYEQEKPLLVTTNLSIDELIKRLGDDRAIWRMVEASEWIEVPGVNFRAKKVEERQKAAARANLKAVR